MRRSVLAKVSAALLPLLCGPQLAAQNTSPASHVDLSGFWGGPPMGLGAPGGGPPSTDQDVSVKAPVRNGDISNLTNDNVLMRRAADNLPLYKPEFWDKVQELDLAGNKADPFTSCMPLAPPRLGPPTKIVQLPNEVLLFYRVMFQRNDFRIVPIGKRSRPIDPDGTWSGDPVAHWEGDTLVIETAGYNDQSWIGPEGYLHGYDMKTTERLKRDGDTLVYDVTVEDPEYLQKPWVLTTQRVARDKNPNASLVDSPPCSDRDNGHIVGTQREL